MRSGPRKSGAGKRVPDIANGKSRDQPLPGLHARDNLAVADAAIRDAAATATRNLGKYRWVSKRPIQSTRRIHFAQRFERQHRSRATSASSNSQLSLLNFPVSG
jgi:hypothetical protein